MVWLEITTLLIPGVNDSQQEIQAMTSWIAKELGPDVPLHFSAFHPAGRMLEFPPTPLLTLQKAREIALKNGLRYVYTGNVHDPEGESTYCHQCGKKIIGRGWYVLKDWNLTENGKCKFCGTVCAGSFDPHPGTWGAKQLPVRLEDFA